MKSVRQLMFSEVVVTANLKPNSCSLFCQTVHSIVGFVLCIAVITIIEFFNLLVKNTLSFQTNILILAKIKHMVLITYIWFSRDGIHFIFIRSGCS